MILQSNITKMDSVYFVLLMIECGLLDDDVLHQHG